MHSFAQTRQLTREKLCFDYWRAAIGTMGPPLRAGITHGYQAVLTLTVLAQSPFRDGQSPMSRRFRGFHGRTEGLFW